MQGEGQTFKSFRSGLCALIYTQFCPCKASSFYFRWDFDVFCFECFCMVPVFERAYLLLSMWPHFYQLFLFLLTQLVIGELFSGTRLAQSFSNIFFKRNNHLFIKNKN